MFINTPCHPNIDVFITKLLKIEGTTDQQGGAANKLSWREHFNIGSKCGGSSTRAEGFHLPIRQMTNSLLGFAFLRSASTSQPFFFLFLNATATFRTRPLILMGRIQWLTLRQTLLSISSALLLWWQILAVSLSWLTLKKPSQKSLCLLLTPTNTFFPHTLDSKQNLHLASRHEKLSHLGFRSFFSPHGPLDDLTKGWYGYRGSELPAELTDRRGEQSTASPTATSHFSVLTCDGEGKLDCLHAAPVVYIYSIIVNMQRIICFAD